IGGVQGALAKKADTIFSCLSPRQQTIARRILLQLTQPGEGTEDTRRRATMAELQREGEEQDTVAEVVKTLTDARLLVTDTDQQVDVAHEALIRGWPRLQAWINENREALQMHRRITEAAREWARNGNDVSYLYVGARLATALERLESKDLQLRGLALSFVQASYEQELREEFRWKRLYEEAESQRQLARTRELAAVALNQLQDDPECSVLLALEAVDARHPNSEVQ